jgi:hypothetical protein
MIMITATFFPPGKLGTSSLDPRWAPITVPFQLFLRATMHRIFNCGRSRGEEIGLRAHTSGSPNNRVLNAKRRDRSASHARESGSRQVALPHR